MCSCDDSVRIVLCENFYASLPLIYTRRQFFPLIWLGLFAQEHYFLKKSRFIFFFFYLLITVQGRYWLQSRFLFLCALKFSNSIPLPPWIQNSYQLWPILFSMWVIGGHLFVLLVSKIVRIYVIFNFMLSSLLLPFQTKFMKSFFTNYDQQSNVCFE